MCPVDGISVHTRRQQTRRRNSLKKKEKLTPQQESFPQDFSLVGHSALNITPSLTSSGHTTVGRIQRGIVTQHGRHLPVILPQLVIGSADHHAQAINQHHQRPTRKVSAHLSLPSVVSPDPTIPTINVTGVPIVIGQEQQIHHDEE